MPEPKQTRYRAYPAYKPSGVDWLGEVPEGWTIIKLSYAVRLHSGDSITSADIEETGDFAVYGGNGKRGFTKKYNCDGHFALIGRQGALCGNINVVSGKFFASEHAIVVHPVKEFALTYLSEFLWFMNLGQYSTSAAQPGISVERLNDLAILLPPLPEQAQIAAFLDYETAKIDALIARQQRLIALLEEKRQAVISHAVTKGLNPDAPLRPSGIDWLGDVPAHWQIPKLLNVTSRIGDGLHSTPIYQESTGCYFINGNNLDDGKIAISESAKEVPESEFKKHFIELDRSSVLMSINGTIGKLAIYENEKIILGKSAAYINCTDCILPEFLLHYLSSSSSKNYYDLEVTGTTIFNLSLGSIRKMKIGLPSVNEQAEIVRFCDAQKEKFQTLLGKAQSTVTLLKERRTALISAAVTGRIDVRGWTPPDRKDTAA